MFSTDGFVTEFSTSVTPATSLPLAGLNYYDLLRIYADERKVGRAFGPATVHPANLPSAGAERVFSQRYSPEHPGRQRRRLPTGLFNQLRRALPVG